MNLLFTNAGRRTYLIEYALELKNRGYDLNIFVCDTSYDTAAMNVDSSIKRFITPMVSTNEEEYLNILLEESLKNSIDIIIPLMDFELPILSKNITKFENHQIKVWVSNHDTIMNCLNKELNYYFCLDNNINVPKSYFNNDITPPLIKKKIFGSGSVGLEIIKGKSQNYSFIQGEDMLQELIVGTEYGMDIFNDYNGNYIHSCARKKILMRAGETDKASSFIDPTLENLAKEISSVFKHRGNMDIDFIRDPDGNIYFIDFNPRFGGGYPFTHLSGANYLKFIIDSHQNGEAKLPKFKKSITGMKGLKLYYHGNK
ncbi:ATP-grasp domain-containing protein [Flavobacteriaceae bacterium Ap0902]|nr:ATP-grasp domain-containing protein [Flavobacteriaceae bacterium Ap0902]